MPRMGGSMSLTGHEPMSLTGHECFWEYAWVDSPEHHRFICRCGEFLDDDEVERRLNAIERLRKHPIMRHVIILFPSIADIIKGR